MDKRAAMAIGIVGIAAIAWWLRGYMARRAVTGMKEKELGRAPAKP